MTSVLLMLVLAAPAEGAVDTIVVCPREFRAALGPWLDHRRAQGHRATFVAAAQSAEAIRAEVRRIAAAAPAKFLVLVGDADPAMATDAAIRARSVPTHHSRAVVNVKYGSEPDIATDNWYADLDGDRVPELAVGRFTADSAGEVSRIVEKILAYETSEDFGRWRSQLHLVAGVGGFGAIADTLLQAAAKTLITDGVPAGFDATLTYASWQSPYCPDPRSFRRVAIERLNEGSLFWIYMGHGFPETVDFVRVPGGAYPILSTRDVPNLACRHASPIACFLACYTGAFDQKRDCLAEAMLRAEGGPVAILCGSRVTMPYAMTVMGCELLDEYFRAESTTLGEMFVAAKRRMAAAATSGKRQAVEAAAKAFGPQAADLDAERAEHLDLFNLVGDPLLRVPRPRTAEVAVEPRAAAGERLAVRGSSPLGGTCTVELVVRRGRLTFQPPRRATFDPESLGEYAEVYRRANEPRLASTRLELPAGSFETQLDVPEAAHGACHVRVYVEGVGSCAVGSADVRIEPRASAKEPTSAAAR